MVKRKKPQPASDFDAVAADFATLGNAVFELLMTIGRDHWPPTSPAGVECADDPIYADGHPTVGSKPVTDAHLEAVASLTTVGDNLRGMADCLESSPNFFSTISLARVATSAAASIWWRLEPEIGSGERVRRRAALQLGAIADRSRMVGRQRHPEAYRSEDQDRVALLAWGDRHGFRHQKVRHAAYDNVQQWSAGAPVPGEMQQVRSLLEPLGSDMPDVVYRITSAFVHSTSNSLLMATSRTVEVSEHGVTQATVQISVGRLVLLTASAVYGTHLTVLRLLGHFGMDAGGWQAMAQPLLIRWGATARAELVMHPLVLA